MPAPAMRPARYNGGRRVFYVGVSTLETPRQADRVHPLAGYAWSLLPPLLLCSFLILLVREPVQWWLRGEEIYDEQAIKEWVREARVGFKTLPELLRELLEHADSTTQRIKTHEGPTSTVYLLFTHEQRRDEILQFLKALGSPPTKVYSGQLPLFPVIYRIEVDFEEACKLRRDKRLNFGPLVWDSEIPRHANQFREFTTTELTRDPGVRVRVQYHLHAYLQRQFQEREDATRRVWLFGGGFVVAIVAVLWGVINQRREQQSERERRLAEQKVYAAERGRLQEDLRRQEAELRRQEAERRKQEAEKHALELKSQMFHGIGIMAKSYAHNIKNLLVRPNDLLRRCAEQASPEQQRMLAEVGDTLATVTQRLQEILQTVQRDPNKFERVRVDLVDLVRELAQTWGEQARDKWKLTLDVELPPTPVMVLGDRSHLQQALENFLLNARDAVGEMRTSLRQEARPAAGSRTPLDETAKQAIIAAAGWKGRVILRVRAEGARAILEVQDNGIGMTAEVRRRCTEPNFSTKRDNALYAGLSAGMGLGLAFVQMILQHHEAALEIDSTPREGTTVRVRFPRQEGG